MSASLLRDPLATCWAIRATTRAGYQRSLWRTAGNRRTAVMTLVMMIPATARAHWYSHHFWAVRGSGHIAGLGVDIQHSHKGELGRRSVKVQITPCGEDRPGEVDRVSWTAQVVVGMRGRRRCIDDADLRWRAAPAMPNVLRWWRKRSDVRLRHAKCRFRSARAPRLGGARRCSFSCGDVVIVALQEGISTNWWQYFPATDRVSGR